MQSDLRISLSNALRQWVDRQVVAHGYEDASEYIRDVLHKEQMRATRKRIDQHLLAALDHGPATEMTARDWHHMRAKGREQAAALRADHEQ